MTDTHRQGGEGAGRIDAAALLATVDIVRVIEGYVPLTKSGAEFDACCPFHTEATPSFKVSPAKQIYHCFGCGAHGDAIGFLQEYRGVGFLEACRELGAEVPEAGGAVALRPPAAVRRDPLRPVKERSPWVPVHPAPAGAPEPPLAHVKRGLPERTWCYRDGEGRVLGYVFRFRTSDGGKETLPLCWARHAETGAEEWHWLAFAEPRPLYGLDRLQAAPEASVLLVEGEKCAEAAQAALDAAGAPIVAVTWPGGGKAVGKADWAPLAGRRVMTWADCDAKRVPLSKAEREALPDSAARLAAQAAKPLLPAAEQPGVRAMAQAREALAALDCALWDIAIPDPGAVADGWDVADALAEGMTPESLVEHLRTQAVRVPPPGALDEIPPGALGEEPPSPPTGACAGPGGYGGDDDDDWRALLLRRDGKLVDCRENVFLMLKHHPQWRGVLWADVFARKIVFRRPPPWPVEGEFGPGREWDESDTMRLGLWLAQRERLLVKPVENLTRAVAWVAADNRWHPVMEYLEALAWDGQPRGGSWLTDYLGVKASPYAALAGQLVLTGLVARIYRPGCQMRFMPILEGPQFRGKSSALRILGGRWFGDTIIDLHNKDVYQLIQGCWVYEVAELDSFNRSEVTRVKAFISSQSDRFRAPYEAAPKDQARQVVFFGSTNQDEYFKDPTGNTRFWPLRTEEEDRINLDGLVGNRDQLLAEAVHRFKAGERWHPTAEEQETLFEPEQAQREIGDPWQDLILRYLKSSSAHKVTVADILTDGLKIEPGRIDRARQQATSVGIVMKRLGWPKRRGSDAQRTWFYERPESWREVPAAPAMDAHGGDHVPF